MAWKLNEQKSRRKSTIKYVQRKSNVAHGSYLFYNNISSV